MANLKRFIVHFDAYVEFSIDESLVKEASKLGSERNQYGFEHRGEVLEHIARNVIINGVKQLSRLDGFADCNNSQMEVHEVNLDYGDLEEIDDDSEM